jgi:hypothetical protein
MTSGPRCFLDPEGPHEGDSHVVSRFETGFTSEQATGDPLYQEEPAENGVRLGVASVARTGRIWPVLDDGSPVSMSQVLRLVVWGPFAPLKAAFDVSLGLVDRQGETASVSRTSSADSGLERSGPVDPRGDGGAGGHQARRALDHRTDRLRCRLRNLASSRAM